MNFLDDAYITATLQLIELQSRSSEPSSPVIVRVEETGFDLQSHLVYRIASDPVKKKAAERKVLSVIRTYLNQGKDASDIESDFDQDPAFNAVLGKHFRKNLDRYVEKSRVWDEHKNQVEIFYNLLCHTYQALQSKKIQKDTKRLAGLMLLVPALTTALSMNRTAICATRYMRNVGSSIALSEDLLEANQDRKWKAYAKVGYIHYIKGKPGGDSNRVEILAYDGPVLTSAQKLEAAETILSFITHEDLASVLRVVLVAIASLHSTPRYGDCDLLNKVEDLVNTFAPIAGEVVETRKAERLIESVEFEAAVQAEAEEVSARVTAHLASGQGLQPVFEVPESPVEAPTALEQHMRWVSQESTKQKALAYASITNGLEF
jgi:hypothetical protein